MKEKQQRNWNLVVKWKLKLMDNCESGEPENLSLPQHINKLKDTTSSTSPIPLSSLLYGTLRAERQPFTTKISFLISPPLRTHTACVSSPDFY